MVGWERSEETGSALPLAISASGASKRSYHRNTRDTHTPTSKQIAPPPLAPPSCIHPPHNHQCCPEHNEHRLKPLTTARAPPDILHPSPDRQLQSQSFCVRDTPLLNSFEKYANSRAAGSFVRPRLTSPHFASLPSLQDPELRPWPTTPSTSTPRILAF